MPGPAADPSTQETVRSVDRALSILQVIAEHGSVGISQIAMETRIHKSTVFRLLTTLELRGMVEQLAERGEYSLGVGVVQLAQAATRRHDLSVISRPTGRRLARDVGETVNTVICDGTDVISIDQHMGSWAITSWHWLGQRAPLHASAAGKAFLAFPGTVDPSELPDRLPALTPRTIVDRDALIADLELVRERGYSVSDEEQEIGLVAVGAPIRELGGAVVGALVVSGPAFRVTAESIPGIAEATTSAAAEISYRNGMPKPG